MENRTADTEYYKKAARILHTVRYAVLLFLLVVVVIGFTFFKNELTYDNFRYIMRYVNFNLSYDYSDTNTLDYAADEGTVYGYLKGDLALLSPKGFRTYDFSGSELMSVKTSMPNPCLKTAGKYALCYDVTGTALELYNPYSNVEKKEFDYGIKDAEVRSDGTYAVATAGKYMRSKVVVHGGKGEFTYETRDKEVIAVSLPEDSEKINFIALSAENGEFRFMLMSYNTSEKTPVVEREFTGEFPLKLYSTKDMMCILTDRALHFVDYNGKTVKKYQHISDSLSGFYQSGSYIAVTYTKNISNNGTMRIFKDDGTEIRTEKFEDGIIGFSSYGNKIYALEKGLLHIMQVDEKSGIVNEDAVTGTAVDKTFTDVFASAENEYILVSPLGAKQVSG